jgi:hypothetical protein
MIQERLRQIVQVDLMQGGVSHLGLNKTIVSKFRRYQGHIKKMRVGNSR